MGNYDIRFEKKALMSPKKLREQGVRVDRIARQVVNRTARKTKTATSKAVRAQLNLPARDKIVPGIGKVRGVNDRIGVFPIKNKAGEASVLLSVEQTRNLLSRFDARQEYGNKRTGRRKDKSRRNRAGVSVKVKASAAGGRRETIRSAFFMRVQRGRRGGEQQGAVAVFIRQEVARRLGIKSVDRGPSGLHALKGPSVDQVFRAQRQNLVDEAAAFMTTELRRRMRVELKKLHEAV